MARKRKSPGYFRLLFILLVLPMALPLKLIGFSFRVLTRRREGKPKSPRKQFLSRNSNLRTPEEAATFVTRNLEDLTFEQIGEIEKVVRLARPAIIVDGVLISAAPLSVIYGCRILKPLESMKDLKKMADRWSRAWYGDTQGIRSGVWLHDPAWIELCQKYWTPFVMNQVNRIVAQSPKITRPQALALFTPELE